MIIENIILKSNDYLGIYTVFFRIELRKNFLLRNIKMNFES